MSLTAEWSHNIDADRLPEGGLSVKIEADGQQSRDLARRLGVDSIDGLTADVKIRRSAMVYHVTGRVYASVTAPCVVTDVPVMQLIDEPFEAWYADQDAAISLTRARYDRARQADLEVPMLEESEDPEPLVDGEIDLGELASQYLALAIDPYPRAEGVAAPEQEIAGEKRPNPFEALKNWKAGRENP